MQRKKYKYIHINLKFSAKAAFIAIRTNANYKRFDFTCFWLKT